MALERSELGFIPEHLWYARGFGKVVLSPHILYDPPVGLQRPYAISATANITYTVENVLSGNILRDCNGVTRTDTFPAAGTFGRFLGLLFQAGLTIVTEVRNTGTEHALTLVAGENCTWGEGSVPLVLEPGISVEIRFVCHHDEDTGDPRITIYHDLPDEPAERPVLPLGTLGVASVTTEGVHTYTPAEILGGFIGRNPDGTSVDDVLPDASALIAAIPDCVVGTRIDFSVANYATGTEVVRVTSPESGYTADFELSADHITVRPRETAAFTLVVTDVDTPALTLYRRDYWRTNGLLHAFPDSAPVVIETANDTITQDFFDARIVINWEQAFTGTAQSIAVTNANAGSSKSYVARIRPKEPLGGIHNAAHPHLYIRSTATGACTIFVRSTSGGELQMNWFEISLMIF